jgi:anaerobic magnesium-protoporphyrin IX monomethyl ester cyclase
MARSPLNVILAVPKWLTQRPIQPMGLLYLGASLRKAGHRVSIIDGEVEQIDNATLAGMVASARPDLFGITATTAQANEAFALARAVKALSPGTYIALGGAHAAALTEECLQECEALDAVSFGEGEVTIVEMMERLADRASMEGVDGVAYRDGDGIVVNPSRALVDDLDSLPFPAWDLIPMQKYVASTWFPNKVKQYTNIFTSRGCPYGCTFCGAKTTWTRKFRARSPENVVAEMEEVLARFHIPNFFISDDLFTLNRKRVMAICELILTRELQVTWTCLSRVNTVDAEMLALMKRAGCYLISYGLESGSQKVLDQLDKGTTIEHGVKAVEMTKAAGIKVFGSFMIGSPGETAETVDETIRYIRTLDLDEIGLGVTTAYPGTDLFETFGKDAKGLDWNKALAFNPSEADHSSVFLKCTDLGDEEIRRLFHKAMREAVLYNPRLVIRRLSHIASVKHLGRSVKAGLKMLTNH